MKPVVERPPLYVHIYDLVRQIPFGKVATYGQIARLEGSCTARMVGYALAALPGDNDVPWQRVINSRGRISVHGDGFGNALQLQLLLAEGVQFDEQGSVDFERFGWLGSPSRMEAQM